MKRVVIPRVEIDQSLVDPNFPRRNKIKADPRSQTVFSLGFLSSKDQRLFSQPLPATPDANNFVPQLETINGDLVYKIPNRHAQFAGAISLIAGHEHSAYPDSRHKQTYITVDQAVLKAETNHRGDMWHSDGTPGEWRHVYVVTDCWPTEFEPDYEANPYEITFMNAGVRHHSPIIPTEATRTFLRVTYVHDISQAGAA